MEIATSRKTFFIRYTPICFTVSLGSDRDNRDLRRNHKSKRQNARAYAGGDKQIDPAVFHMAGRILLSVRRWHYRTSDYRQPNLAAMCVAREHQL